MWHDGRCTPHVLVLRYRIPQFDVLRDSDTAAMAAALARTDSVEALVRLVGTVKGPWAFLWWQVRAPALCNAASTN